jgi:F-type H+-transporting ATPase subunit epsilon
MKVKITTPQKILFNGQANEIILPGCDGEFTVMDFHQPCLYALRRGKITLKFKSKTEVPVKFLIKGGVAQVDFEGLNLAVESFS